MTQCVLYHMLKCIGSNFRVTFLFQMAGINSDNVPEGCFGVTD